MNHGRTLGFLIFAVLLAILILLIIGTVAMQGYRRDILVGAANGDLVQCFVDRKGKHKKKFGLLCKDLVLVEAIMAYMVGDTERVEAYVRELGIYLSDGDNVLQKFLDRIERRETYIVAYLLTVDHQLEINHDMMVSRPKNYGDLVKWTKIIRSYAKDYTPGDKIESEELFHALDSVESYISSYC